MDNNIKVFIVGNNTSYSNFLDIPYEKVINIKDENINIFTGGEDVHPDMYNKEMKKSTCANINRDIEEKAYYDIVKDNMDILKIGICRGSQFLTVMNGGMLVQDCRNHAIGGTHHIDITYDNVIYKKVNITSTHHQMMFPYELPEEDYDLIAVSSVNRSNVHECVEWKDEYKEPEMVYDNKTNCFCIQGHPEYMYRDDEVVIIINNIIKDKLNIK